MADLGPQGAKGKGYKTPTHWPGEWPKATHDMFDMSCQLVDWLLRRLANQRVPRILQGRRNERMSERMSEALTLSQLTPNIPSPPAPDPCYR